MNKIEKKANFCPKMGKLASNLADKYYENGGKCSDLKNLW